MINFKAADAIKAKIEKLESLFDKISEGEIEATDEQSQEIIDRIDELEEKLDMVMTKKITNWSEELASLNID